MADWSYHFSSLEDITRGIGQFFSGEGLPIYKLAPPGRRLPETTIRAARFSRAGFEANIYRRSDSGVIEINWGNLDDLRLNMAFERQSREEFLLSIASEEDLRAFNRADENDAQEVSVELESSIQDVGVPVVGPGGRVTLYSDLRSADVVIRAREKLVLSKWRDPGDVARSFYREVEASAPTRICITFGYFELSKYEAQEWLRPVLILIADRTPEAITPGWRYVAVEPATSAPRISDSSGLGSWSTQ